MEKQITMNREAAKAKKDNSIMPAPTHPDETSGNESQTMSYESAGGLGSEVYYEAPRGEGGQPVEVEGFDTEVIRESRERRSLPPVQPKSRTRQTKQPKGSQEP